MILNFILGFVSCLGFGYIFNCPLKAIIKGCIAGGFSWVAYKMVIQLGHGTILATFIGAIVLSIFCEICARIYKDAVTVFVLPAILPLVPGAGLYYTMLYFIQTNYDLAVKKGVETLGCAVAIAIALLIVSSISKLIFKIIKEIKYRKKDLADD